MVIKGQTTTLTGWHQRKRNFLLQILSSDKYFCHTVKAPGRNSMRQRRMANKFWDFKKSKTIRHILKLRFSTASTKLKRKIFNFRMLSTFENFILITNLLFVFH
jgi:hypothetical protein